ncbi:MAG: hypothetical protein K0R69_2149 [Clostridia bacterium]|jgi:hypothetical protein|nr:hypothetical protein [Clostridia bacterium]
MSIPYVVLAFSMIFIEESVFLGTIYVYNKMVETYINPI